MSNIIKFFIVGMTGFIVCKNINDIFYKPIKNSVKKPITSEIGTQTELTNKELEAAILCKKDLDAITRGTYEWKFV